MTASNELVDKLFDKITKQDKFILEMFQDSRIGDEVKHEYAEKYNELNIKAK